MRKQFKNISLLVFLLSLFITGGSHAAPKDIQSIIDTAKLGHLTEDMHKKYWDWANSFGNSGDDDSLKLKKILNWYPKINRLQLQYNRELIKSLKKRYSDLHVGSPCSKEVIFSLGFPEGNFLFL